MVIEPGSFRTGIQNRTKISGTPIEDYNGTAGGMFRSMKQQITPEMFPGDPAKAAQVIYEVAKSEQNRHWVVLGSDAQRRITAKLDQQRAELEAGEELASSTDFPDSADLALL